MAHKSLSATVESTRKGYGAEVTRRHQGVDQVDNIKLTNDEIKQLAEQCGYEVE